MATRGADGPSALATSGHKVFGRKIWVVREKDGSSELRMALVPVDTSADDVCVRSTFVNAIGPGKSSGTYGSAARIGDN
jgi:hypothetical protein